MATNKTGIDYYPFDVGFFDDDKIQFVGARFGLKGENITIRLLCKIYSEGYYYRFGEDESLLFAKRVGDGCQYSFVNDIVYELVKRGFFDGSIFDRFKILTSSGIQKRYFEAVLRRKSIDVYEELLLTDVSKMDNVNILSKDAYIIDQNGNISTQSKGKETKEKETNTAPRGYESFSFDFLSKEFKDLFLSWLDYKRQRSEKYKTQKSIELCYKQLLNFSQGNPFTASKIVEKSMANNWAGLFDLKKDYKHPSTTHQGGKNYEPF